MKKDNLIRCDICGVILIDPRRKKLRSCPHKPLTIEEIDGKRILTLGVAKRDDAIVVSEMTFDECFDSFVSKM